MSEPIFAINGNRLLQVRIEPNFSTILTQRSDLASRVAAGDATEAGERWGGAGEPSLGLDRAGDLGKKKPYAPAKTLLTC